MINQYENVVKVVISLLKSLNVKVTSQTVNESMQNHPDYPSLLCISDTLTQLKVSNAAIRYEKEKLNELPLPFIAHMQQPADSLVLVTEIDNGTVQCYTGESRGSIPLMEDFFLKTWTGVCLIAEASENSGEIDFVKNKKIEKAKLLKLIAFSSIIIFLGLLSVVQAWLLHWSLSQLAGLSIFFLILFTGVVVTVLLLWYEIDKANPLLQKVCTGIVKTNCNAVLNSKGSRLFKWLSWSEIGFFYFAGGLLNLLFYNATLLKTVSFLSAINALVLPYIFFSVFYQWRIAKQWCILCLAVQALLLFGFINSLIAGFLSTSIFETPGYLIHTCLLYLSVILTWFLMKPFLLRIQKAKREKRNYLRLKFNQQIFESLLYRQKTLSPTEGLGIILGNKANPKHIITKVCNPFCGPCAAAHPKIIQMLAENQQLQLRIVFTSSNDEATSSRPVKHFLSLQENQDEKLLTQALNDWYGAKEKNYDSFAIKYPLQKQTTDQASKVDAMYAWCTDMNIRFTPTYFIDGYQMPEAYSIQDINYFLSE